MVRNELLCLRVYLGLSLPILVITLLTLPHPGAAHDTRVPCISLAISNQFVNPCLKKLISINCISCQSPLSLFH